MPNVPIITFKAGECESDFDSEGPTRVQPVSTPGYIYLYGEEDFVRFCWRERSQSLDNPKLELLVIPSDATFKPYLSKGAPVKKSPVNGRVFVLKFRSSPVRHLFWLQSAAKDPSTPSFFSKGDLKLGEIVDRLLQGEDPESVESDLATLRQGRHDGGYDLDEDEDEAMEDADQAADGNAASRHDRRGSGGAGPDATGGDFREEGEDSREGGGDGARAVSSSNPVSQSDANATIQNFLQSLGAGAGVGQQQQQSTGAQEAFTTLVDLLPTSTTIPMLADPSTTDAFLTDLIAKHLPSSLLYLTLGMDPQEIPDDADSDPEALAALADALEPEQKRDLLRRVLRSPQFHQAQTQITQALRDGGLPAVAGAVGVKVDGNGYVNERAGIAVNGGKAVQVFVEGVKKAVEEEDQQQKGNSQQ